jgi:hypothetical protein
VSVLENDSRLVAHRSTDSGKFAIAEPDPEDQGLWSGASCGADEPEAVDEARPARSRPQRLAVAMLAALRAAAWWLAGSRGSWRLLGALTVGLLAGGAAWAAPALVDAVVCLANAMRPPGLLADPLEPDRQTQRVLDEPNSSGASSANPPPPGLGATIAPGPSTHTL